MSDIVDDLQDPNFRGAMQHLRNWSELDAMHDRAAAEITRLRTFITALEDGNMTFLCDELDKAKAENARLRSLVEEAGKVVEEQADRLSDRYCETRRNEYFIAEGILRSLLTKMKEG